MINLNIKDKMTMFLLLLFSVVMMQSGPLFDQAFEQWFEHTPKLSLTDLQERKKQFDRILSKEAPLEGGSPRWIENFFSQSNGHD